MSTKPDSEPANLTIDMELKMAQSLGLIATADVSEGVKTNLLLLDQHSEIVASAMAELDRRQE